ncbi:TetR family transcriptional regulator [Streptomyces kaempferi]
MASREILETALRLFIEQGYDETTIAQIAREAAFPSAPSSATSAPRRTFSAATRTASGRS